MNVIIKWLSFVAMLLFCIPAANTDEFFLFGRLASCLAFLITPYACSGCLHGYYSTEPNSTSCTACSEYTNTIASGSSSVEECYHETDGLYLFGQHGRCSSNVVHPPTCSDCMTTLDSSNQSCTPPWNEIYAFDRFSHCLQPVIIGTECSPCTLDKCKND